MNTATLFDRAREEELLTLCASEDTDPSTWRRHGDGFFMGGLAVMLASVSGFDRRRYLDLAEELHAGISQPEAFDLWLQRTPVRPARFIPMLRRAIITAKASEPERHGKGTDEP